MHRHGEGREPLSAVTSSTEVNPAKPAATVLLLRDGSAGLEVLMVRRGESATAYGGLWVFPGGRVDPADASVGEDLSSPEVARRAAARELLEETGLVVEPTSLIQLSHWTPSAEAPRRFSTWFFVARGAETKVSLSEHELIDSRWTRPVDILEQRERGDVKLAPPTFVTLLHMSRFGSVAEALGDTERSTPPFFAGRRASTPHADMVLYEGDAGFDDADPARGGARHRLVMQGLDWQYQRSP